MNVYYKTKFMQILFYFVIFLFKMNKIVLFMDNFQTIKIELLN